MSACVFMKSFAAISKMSVKELKDEIDRLERILSEFDRDKHKDNRFEQDQFAGRAHNLESLKRRLFTLEVADMILKAVRHDWNNNSGGIEQMALAIEFVLQYCDERMEG